MPIAPAVGAAMIGSGTQIGGSLLSMLVQKKREKRAMANTKELMALQHKNQQELNKQGQNLQLDTWEKTNYPAQMEMLKEAGLNPALLYGMSGGGGTTTGSQSGGTAASGSAPAPMQPMDLGNALQGAATAAQIKLTNAQAKNIEKDTELKSIDFDVNTETKEALINLIKADSEIKQTSSISEQLETIFKWISMGGTGDFDAKSGNKEGNIDTESIKLSERFKEYVTKNKLTEAEGRIKFAEAELIEKLRKVGANDTTVNAVLSILKLFALKAGSK